MARDDYVNNRLRSLGSDQHDSIKMIGDVKSKSIKPHELRSLDEKLGYDNIHLAQRYTNETPDMKA